MTEPTDAELEALLVDKAPILALVGANVRTAVVKAMREAFAKWGTPPAVAPWRSAVLDLIDECPGLTLEQDRWLSRRVKELDFASTPQPTQAQAGAVPLTDEQITAAAKKLAECMEYPWEFMPEPGRKNMRKHAQDVIDAAHGIKGGQHG